MKTDTTQKPLILIVDDEPINLQILVNTLENDHRVRVATSGAGALKIARSADMPDLILLDVRMPEMDGYEVCQALKKDEKTSLIPVIFVTAMGLEDGEMRGLELGAVDYISKPINPAITKLRVNVHLKIKRLQDQLIKLSNHDSLTGISNRRNFNAFLDLEWRRSLREKSPLAVIMADVDFFKRYNDFYGHPSGDDCLVNIANVLNSLLNRPGDLAARYGGEEFIGILSNTTLDGAHQIAESFRAAVEQLAIPHSGHPLGRVTVSCGVHAITPDNSVTPAEMVAIADKHLYIAKESGRNKVISSPNQQSL